MKLSMKRLCLALLTTLGFSLALQNLAMSDEGLVPLNGKPNAGDALIVLFWNSRSNPSEPLVNI